MSQDLLQQIQSKCGHIDLNGQTYSLKWIRTEYQWIRTEYPADKVNIYDKISYSCSIDNVNIPGTSLITDAIAKKLGIESSQIGAFWSRATMKQDVWFDEYWLKSSSQKH